MKSAFSAALLFALSSLVTAQTPSAKTQKSLFLRDNLVAWCIVPFDAKKRGPEDRAAMLERLRFKRYAYDWRAEHLPTFDTEIAAIHKRGVALDAVWFPAALNADARKLLDVLKNRQVKTQLWITMGDPDPKSKDQEAKVAAAARILGPIADEAGKIGCTVALYNHGGWFGEPENQVAIINLLGRKNVGIVYNLHHGHHHLDRFPTMLKAMLPHLWALNLNGMVKDGDKIGKKILPLGAGDLDLELLKTIQASGYRGPIGILGHTMDDAEERLRDNLDGLDWLLAQLEGKPAGPRPKYRTYKAPVNEAPKKGAAMPVPLDPKDAKTVARIVAEAKAHGDPRHGAVVFQSPQFACVGCHKLGKAGGVVGPDLTLVSRCLSPEQIVESLLWPKRHVKDEFIAVSVITADGKQVQGYKVKEDASELVLRDPATGKTASVKKGDIDERRDLGSLMPEGLAAAMTESQLRDLVRFLTELGRTEGLADLAHAHSHTAANFPIERAPLQPKYWPSWEHPVNARRLYDFYARQADYFMKQPSVPALLPPFPGIDRGAFGHWGGQNEKSWMDERWNDADLGSVISGVFRGDGVLVPRGVCVRLGDQGEMAACFNPETLCYEVVWRCDGPLPPPLPGQKPRKSAGFIRFSATRHGFMDGLILDGKPVPHAKGAKPEKPFVYRGFYRHGARVLFSYTLEGVDMLDSAWVEEGKFVRSVAPAAKHPLAKWTRGGPPQWPQVIETKGKPGDSGGPYVVDIIQPPFDNPWKAPIFFGDHDFLPCGSALACTMQGDVWRIDGLDDTLERVRWKRFASGLHQALGIVVAKDGIYVLGRDQITRLHDLNGDGEADFYECFSNAYQTSPGGHDFITGLQRDEAGAFYTASSKQGLVRIAPDGKKVDVLATGFRNPDGIGLYPDGALTVPCSEGEWTPASQICLVKPAESASSRIPHFGYGGPKDGPVPDLPLVYLPRGIDNSSGGQTYISSDRWGPLKGRMIHTSFGAASHFLLLRDEVEGQPQGAIVPLQGEFLSGAHRGRFSPRDGQLYVSGMSGWGTYSLADGCFQRVRFTGESVQLPAGFHVHQNGILVSFTRPVDRDVAGRSASHFAQAWNYRYSAAYGSPELSPRHPGTKGHDHVPVASAHVTPDGLGVFLEMPDLQPVSQLHLRLHVDRGPAQELFLTVHRLDAPYTAIPNYKPIARPIAAHPILADLRATAKSPPNPWKIPLPKSRSIKIEADKNLTFAQRTLTVKAGEPIKLTFANPDAVPHNWVLIKPGTLERIGDQSNKLIAEPDAAVNHYIPKSKDVLAYTDIVPPAGSFTISFFAPETPGRYPYLCTFPGHWMVMNGVMVVEK